MKCTCCCCLHIKKRSDLISSVKAKERRHIMTRVTIYQLEGAKCESTIIIFMVFTEVLTGRGESLEGKLEDERTTKRTTTQALNIIQKVPETAIHLKADEERWRVAQGSINKRHAGGQGTLA